MMILPRFIIKRLSHRFLAIVGILKANKKKTILIIALKLVIIHYLISFVGQIFTCITWPHQSFTSDDVHKRLIDISWNYTVSNYKYEDSLLLMDPLHQLELNFEVINDVKILPPSARIIPRKIFKSRSLVIWATEWHMTPIKDIQILLEPFGVKVLNYNLDKYRCKWQDCTAMDKLKILNPDNVLDINDPIPQQFYEAYKNDSEMKSVDVVFCGYPASICEIYIPLNKSVIVLPSTRYDVGRYTVERWYKTNQNLRILAEKPWNIFGGNNLYDAKFLEYYTGIKTQHIPSVCDYTGAEYTNEINEFLVLRRRDHCFSERFFEEFHKLCEEIKCSSTLRLLENYEFKEVAKYRAIIHVPYQISVMSIFEQYRMNIPMFFPSPELLARWQVDHYIMPERSFDGAFFGRRPNASIIPPHPSQVNVPDPKNELDYNSTLYWMGFADFYQVLPYGIIFESISHLAAILKTITDDNLMHISGKMRQYNIEFKKQIIQKWEHILLQFAKNSPHNPH